MSQIKEIEVKARVQDLGPLKHKLDPLGCVFSDPVLQDDTVYMPDGVGLHNIQPGQCPVRIHLENGKAIFNLKQRQSTSLSSVEKELEISDPKMMEEIILVLGYYKFPHLQKTRMKCRHKGYEVCLDDIHGLGKYIEVEKMSDGDDEKTQEELFQFLETLGVKRKK